jgi:hypothetical protein
MTERPVRDILAQCMRQECRPNAFWPEDDHVFKAQFLDRAGHLTRLLARYGVKLVATKDAQNMRENIPDTFWHHEIAPGMAVFMRAEGDARFSVVYAKDGKENAVSADLAEVLILADRIVNRDETVKSEPGVMTKLAGGFSMLWMAFAPRPSA